MSGSGYLVYRLLSSGLFWSGFGPLWAAARIGGASLGLAQRLGRYDRGDLAALSGRPRFWLHAASVGEVGVAGAIADEMRRRWPDAAWIVSAMTTTGQAAARRRFPAATACVLAPLDVHGLVRRALREAAPDILVFIETELWPNWLMQARQFGIPTVVVNGRLSKRSVRTYRHARALLKPVLATVARFSMMAAEDARRLHSLGAPRHRVVVNGNAKFDQLDMEAENGAADRWRAFLDLPAGVPVIVAGSTRSGEDELVLEAFGRLTRRYPTALLILAPRHPRRSAAIVSAVTARGMTCQRRSRIDPPRSPRTASVVVLDTIGELRALYAAATVVFCGGSLVPRGGQNLLEPVAWGKPVIYGPHMDDFREAEQLVASSGGGKQVQDRHELTAALLALVADRDMAGRAGRAAQRAVLAHRGAAARHAAVIAEVLAERAL